LGRSYFHLHLVSDATGETLIAVSRAVAAQYQGIASIEHIYPLVRTQAQLDKIIAEIKAAPGIVLFTLVDQALTERLEEACRECGAPSLSVLQPIISLFHSYLGTASTARPGAQHMLNAEYFRRIDALNYTMLHDDGQHTDNLEEADVVLLGVSRTSKTPTSIYLANRAAYSGCRSAVRHRGAAEAPDCRASCFARAHRADQAKQVIDLECGNRDALCRPHVGCRRSRDLAASVRHA
jgi:regulator of PEP synthase PpsR (kinase-PPPase family)